MLPKALASLALAAALLGCGADGPPASCAPELYGYESSSWQQEVLDAAVARVDELLDPGLGQRLATGPQVARGTVQARLADGPLAKGDVAVVAASDCVFLNRDWARRLDRLFSADTPGTLEIKRSDALAVVLLHELGHLQRGDAAPDFALLPSTAHPFLQSLSREKSEELRADAFAARQIRMALGARAQRNMAALQLVLALTEIGWNLQANRQLNDFGATSLRLARTFGETSYTHPNLELRFLIINYLVTPSEPAAQLLDSFLSARAHPGDAKPLWGH